MVGLRSGGSEQSGTTVPSLKPGVYLAASCVVCAEMLNMWLARRIARCLV
jgi:hypothetical protein